MMLRELTSSVATIAACIFVIHLAVGVVHSSDNDKRARIALSANAQHYIYLRR
jgi:hypothetical protein